MPSGLLHSCLSPIRLGPRITCEAETIWDIKCIDDYDSPFVKVGFRYRSLSKLRPISLTTTPEERKIDLGLGDLKTIGCIPRTPSPVPLCDRPEKELSENEVRQALREVSQIHLTTKHN